MDNSIDRRFVTDEFLLKYFPDPERYTRLQENPNASDLGIAEERYLEWREKVNERGRGRPMIADCDLVRIITSEEGYVELIKPAAVAIKREGT